MIISSSSTSLQCTSWPPRCLRNVLVCVSSRNEDLISKCGDDARIYIMFQYHLIIFMLILCIPSLGIILPINYTGTVLGRRSSVSPGPREQEDSPKAGQSLDLSSLEIQNHILRLKIRYGT